MDHRSTTITHLKNRKGKKERKESKSLHTGTESLVYTMAMDRFGKKHFTCTLHLCSCMHAQFVPIKAHSLGLDSSVCQFGGKKCSCS